MKKPVLNLSLDDAEKHYVSLKNQVKNKNLVGEKLIDLAILTALSYYPSLQYTCIDFTRKSTKNIAHISSVRPISLLVDSKEKRNYVINIAPSLTVENMDEILFDNISFNGRVGVLGHELAHTLDYLNLSALAIVNTGLMYINPYAQDEKRDFEVATDMRAINQGLGFQIKEWKDQTYSTHKKIGRAKYYLSPEEVTSILENHELYSQFFSEKP